MTAAVTRPEPWYSGDEIPDGYHFEVAREVALRWTTDPAVVGRTKRCRFTGGPDRRQCGNTAVAALDRSHDPKVRRWWAYCSQHMYGRWIEDGRVVGWRLVKNDQPDR